MKFLTGIILVLFGTGICFATPPFNQQVVTVQQRQVLFDANAFVGTNGYYSYAADLAGRRNDDAIQKLIEQNNKLIELLEKKLNCPPQPTPNPPNPQPTPTPPGPTPTPPQPQPDPTPSLDKIERAVSVIFSSNCAKCHGATKQDAGLALIKNGSLNTDLDLADATLIYHVTNGVNLASGETQMPKGAPKLSADEIETVRLWSVNMAKKIIQSQNK